MKNTRFIGVLILFFGLIMAVAVVQAGEKGKTWKAPQSADELKNPLTDFDAASKAGKAIFGQMCAICHGQKGKGDGIAGMGLTPRPSNLISDRVKAQSDGALFWKMSEGNPPMAAYKSTLSEEQRWQLVSFIRYLERQK